MSDPVSILLVDDEERNLNVLESILGRSGHRLVRAQTADEALMALLSGEFAAIVLDIKMPGISGIELAQLIKERKRTRDIPILFLTAHLSDERDVLRGYDVGAVDYLTKPVNPDILRSKIAVFVDLFRKTRALAAANQALENEVVERQRAEEALRLANEDLEARVQERTADLTQAFEEKRQLLESERAARSEAERASRLKDEFLAVVSHELRTPLNAILGWAHILNEGQDGLPDVVVRGLETIIRNARAQAHLIEDLLDMSRIVSGRIRLNLQAVSLSEIVSAAVGTVTPAAQVKKIRIECDVDGEAPTVHGDPERLQQVVLNLLSNAVKFTPEGGQVLVSIQDEPAYAEIAIKDTGEGIPPEFLPHVFDPFSQADSSTTRRHGGLGLGLAVVSHLVELHRGSVRVNSPGVGLGSTFTVHIPRALEGAQGKAEAVAAIPGARVGAGTGFLSSASSGTSATSASSASSGVRADLDGLRLLVVEDEPDTRDAITRFLQHYGAAVIAVGSAGEALDQLLAEDFDVLVSDIGMPGMDGYDLIRELRTRETSTGRHLPALAVTAFARDEDRQRVLREGYSEHVPKPVNTARLISLLMALGGRKGASLPSNDRPMESESA